jgi:hypothetical protein
LIEAIDAPEQAMRLCIHEMPAVHWRSVSAEDLGR